MPDRRVSIEAAGPARLRVEGSSALFRQLRKRIAGTVAAPYTGPQPWISRYMSLPWIAPCVLVIAACIWSMAHLDHATGEPSVYKCGEPSVYKCGEPSALRAAEAGDAAGMAHLGMMYENGRGGLPKDDSQAVNWYRKAAAAGNDYAVAALKRLGVN
jgi:hypothetical protein